MRVLMLIAAWLLWSVIMGSLMGWWFCRHRAEVEVWQKEVRECGAEIKRELFAAYPWLRGLLEQ